MRNNESGRSMVEMLGVLAIMGILSIGGIAGYTYAMNRLKANDIIDGVNKRAVALSTYTLLGTGVSATTLDAEFANKIGDFPVALAAADPGFTLTVSEITRPVCNHVLNNGVQMARTITLGATKVWENGVKADYTCAEDGNTIVFTFAPAAGEGGNTPTCGYCQHVENGTCVADETCDNDCPGDKPMKDTVGKCFACSETSGIYAIDATECAKCPNHEMSDWKCVFICTDTPRDTNGYCQDCNSRLGFNAKVSECAKCPNREIYGGRCALKKCLDGFFRTNYGDCVECSSESTFRATTTECAKCSNRETNDGFCGLKECPDGKFRDIKGGCYACSYDWGVKADATECAKCSNRYLTSDGKCARK